MRFGLEQQIIDTFIEVFEANSKVDKAYMFGSRAKGNYRPDSDIDISVKGQDLSSDDIIAMSVAFETKGIAHKFDLINYNSIKEPALKEHIDSVGIEFYSRWKKLQLSKATTFIVDNRGKTVPTESSGIPLIATNCINNNNLYPSYENLRYISQNTYDTWFRSHPEPGDIILTLKGSQNGAVCLVPNPVGFVIAQDMVALRVNKKIIDPYFLFAALRSSEIQNEIKNLDVSGVIPHLKKSDFDKLFLPYPDMDTQKIIGSIYYSISNKMDLLKRQNKTLELLAETFFRQWFVEDEWKGTLSKYAKIQGGYAFKSKNFRENGFAGIIKITNISMGFIDISKSDFVDETVIKNLDRKFKIKSGDFLIAMTGAEIGKIGIVEKTEKEIWLNQRVGKLEAKVPYGDIIGYLALKSREGQDHILNACSGSAQENISTTGIEEMVFAKYDEAKANSFGKEARPLFDKIIFNLKQIRTLTQTRDILLPKLMSGEVRLNLKS